MKSDANRVTTTRIEFDLGKRDAVRHKSGGTVTHSVPVLKEPTLSPRASRKLAACPAVSQGAKLAPCASAKSGQGLGQSPMSAEGALPFSRLDPPEIAKLIEFFLLLDTWDRRRHDTPLL
jgi:hypothetical protein